MPTTRTKSAPTVLLDDKIPIEHRRHLLAEVCNSESKEADKLVQSLLKAAAEGSGEDLFRQKRKELEERLEALQSGPQRPGLFFGLLPANGTSVKRAHVRLQDGTATYPVVSDDQLAATLARGDGVLLSGRAEAVLAADPIGVEAGEEARLEDTLGDRVEVSLRSGEERHVLHVSTALAERLETGDVPRGTALLVCLRRQMAFDIVPRPTDEWSRFRYLSREQVPDVVAERDIGAPPTFIAEAIEFCRQEMVAPELRRKYRLRRSKTYMLAGVSGSGKTLCLCACVNGVYEVMAEVTGIPVAELPPRIIKLKMSKLLSMWLGESDKNADLLVDEIVALAELKVTGPNGTFELPVIVIFEELDGIARRRGGDVDGVYDRIQTTLLQRLDHTATQALRDRLILMFATTNVPHLIDPAWVRRVGGQSVRFGRLSRKAFAAVLAKHLRDVPLASDNGARREAVQAVLVRQITAALFSPNGADPGLVEIQLAGTTAPCTKHRRDFLTGSIVDRAVQAAADRACGAEEAGCATPGISAQLLLDCIDEQVTAVASALQPANAADFVDLPDGMRVTGVRRIPRPAVLPGDLQRTSA
ncbi:MAG: AAA family ATPase [Planctomycetota bacterium]